MTSLFYQKSPLGFLRLESDGTSLTSISFCDNEPEEAEKPDLILNQTAEQLSAYFEGEITHFNLNTKPRGTEFQKIVWHLLEEIPYGEKITYLALAQELKNPKAIRAVARANGANPLPIIIPCHRVIGSDGSLTGYAGGLERKRWLLEHENAIVPDNQLTFF